MRPRPARLRVAGSLRIGKRVEVAYQTLEPFLEYVGIDLGRRNVGMPEQRLYNPQISTVLQKMACEGMAQDVRAHARRRHAGVNGQFFEFAGRVLAREMAALSERWK